MIRKEQTPFLPFEEQGAEAKSPATKGTAEDAIDFSHLEREDECSVCGKPLESAESCTQCAGNPYKRAWMRKRKKN